MAEIAIKIVLPQINAAPPKWVGQVLRDIERVVYSNERDLLDAALQEFSDDIDPVTRDAALYRFARLRGQTLLITSVEQGSIVIKALVAAATYWVLDKTIGESFKSAWKGTLLDHKLQEFFRYRIDDIPHRIAHKLAAKYRPREGASGVAVRNSEREVPRKRRRKPKWVASSIGVYKSDNGDYTIELTARDAAMEQFPFTYSKLLKDERLSG